MMAGLYLEEYARKNWRGMSGHGWNRVEMEVRPDSTACTFVQSMKFCPADSLALNRTRSTRPHAVPPELSDDTPHGTQAEILLKTGLCFRPDR